ncbi:MAG: hypothetical protein GXO68_05745 [Crenarchaeota archaeon]|nr:hypothetical protein [Thermoproteota archaeon]
MPEIRVRISNQIYRELRKLLSTMTWKEIIEAALANYIKQMKEDPTDKLRWEIIKTYTEARAIRRVIWMWHRLKDMEDLAERRMLGGVGVDEVEQVLALALKKRIAEGKKLIEEYLYKLKEEGFEVDDVIKEIEKIEAEIKEETW